MSISVKNRELTHISFHKKVNLLAVVGRRSSIVLRFDDKNIQIMQNYLDEDKDENLICSEFIDIEENVYLVVGGELRIVKIIDISRYSFYGFLRGHGGSITELKSHTICEGILFSASEDTTIRMWNIKSKKCLAIFGGFTGHRDYVLSIDVSMCGNMLVSSGTDCTIKVWKIPNVELNKIESIYFPIYSSSKIHKSYISCVRFYGKIIISKSVSNRIVAIYPDFSTEIYKNSINSDSLFIGEYKLSKKDVFINKFDICDCKLITSTVSESGELLVFNLENLNSHFMPRFIKTGTNFIRDVAYRGNRIFVLFNNSEIKQILTDGYKVRP